LAGFAELDEGVLLSEGGAAEVLSAEFEQACGSVPHASGDCLGRGSSSLDGSIDYRLPAVTAASAFLVLT
jgi:hypothetical protein